VSVPPDLGYTGVEEGFEVGHGEDGVEDEAEEVRERGVRDAICGPGTVVVHFRDTSNGNWAKDN
jgi:hypothetical protein